MSFVEPGTRRVLRRRRARLASALLIPVAAVAVGLVAPSSAFAAADPAGHLRQSDDCTGADLAAGSSVTGPFSVVFAGLPASVVGVFDFHLAGEPAGGERFGAGPDGTACSVQHPGTELGPFEASFTWNDDAGSHEVEVTGVLVATDPTDTASPTDSASPTDTASPTASASPTDTVTPSNTPTPAPSTTAPGVAQSPSQTPSTTSSATPTQVGSSLPETGADPRLAVIALAVLALGAALYRVGTGKPRHS